MISNKEDINMKEYNKPYIIDEEIELEDVVAASGTRNINQEDEVDPFDEV